jgi:tetrahydromethanopterin S-methyltransferase subunit G
LPSIENNSDDWREIRARADSIASAVFIISGGALSLSITVLLGGKDSGLVNGEVAGLATASWYLLLASIFFFLLLKGHLIIQASLLQFKPKFVENHLRLLNGIGWVVGASGLVAFVSGMVIMVRAAVVAIHA